VQDYGLKGKNRKPKEKNVGDYGAFPPNELGRRRIQVDVVVQKIGGSKKRHKQEIENRLGEKEKKPPRKRTLGGVTLLKVTCNPIQSNCKSAKTKSKKTKGALHREKKKMKKAASWGDTHPNYL